MSRRTPHLNEDKQMMIKLNLARLSIFTIIFIPMMLLGSLLLLAAFSIEPATPRGISLSGTDLLTYITSWWYWGGSAVTLLVTIAVAIHEEQTKGLWPSNGDAAASGLSAGLIVGLVWQLVAFFLWVMMAMVADTLKLVLLHPVVAVGIIGAALFWILYSHKHSGDSPPTTE